jgi:hypothetical protein
MADLTTRQLYSFGDSLYLLSIPGTWGEAQAEAKSVQGNLVTINDAAEQTFVAGLFANQPSWIGYTDSGVEKNFQWVSGENSLYTNWEAGQPNDFFGEDFTVLQTTGDWNDFQGSAKFPGIIEIKNPATPLLVIEDLGIIEPASGSNQVQFKVQRYGNSNVTTTVNYSTANGTTVAGTNYASVSGTLVFNPGETIKTVGVTVSQDADAVSGETFFLNLSSPTNATLADNQGKATMRESSEAVTFEGHTYLLSNPGSWGQAQAQARSFGGNLVTINSAQEQTFLAGKYTGQRLWIGYSDAGKEWNATTREGFQWVSGTSAYTNWAANAPNNFFGEDFTLLESSGTWNDIRGSETYRGIIEIPSIVNSPGIGTVPPPESNPGGKDPITGNPSNDVLVGTNRSESLTGGAGADRFLYAGSTQRSALRKSSINTLDHITDFNGMEGDRIQLDFDNNLATVERPRKLFDTQITSGNTLIQAARNAYSDRDKQLRGNQALKGREAVIFKWSDRTYLSINDNNRRFNENRDLVVDVTGIKGMGLTSGAAQLGVSNYFA